MYLIKGFKGKNHFWRYFVTVIIVIAATQIGAIPLGVLMVLKSMETGVIPDSSNITDFSAFGIDPNLGLVMMVIPFLVGLFTLLFLIRGFHQRTITDTLTGRDRFDLSRMWFGILVWLCLWIIVILIHFLVEPENFQLSFDPSRFYILVVVTILFIPFQSSFEEVLFRGYLMQGFAVLSRNRWIPLVITSLAFGLLHAFNPEVKEYGFFVTIPQYIVFGLFFGIITIMDDGLELALGVHAINNIFLSIFFTHDVSTLQTPALFRIREMNPVTDLIELVLVSAVFTIIVSLRFGWGNWGMLVQGILKRDGHKQNS